MGSPAGHPGQRCQIQCHGQNTLIEFAKFGVEIVLVGKTCNFNSVDLKKAQKIIKGQIFFQRPNAKIFKFYDFFTDLGYFAVNYSEKVIGLSIKAIHRY